MGKALIGLVIGVVIGGFSVERYFTTYLMPKDLLASDCQYKLGVFTDEISAWDEAFGSGRGEKARELCKLIVE